MVLTKRFALTFGAFVFLRIATAAQQVPPAGEKGQVEHGRYLVQNVGLCGDCHTPRDDHGQPIESRALEGANLTFKPLGPVPNWAGYAPPLVGLSGFTDDQMVTFLTTGKDPSRNLPRPPMPAYRFNKKDAVAVVTYLRSLTPKKKE